MSFPYAHFGNSDALQVGDRIFAMGSPLAFSQSVTMGVVSNTELVLPETFPDPSRWTARMSPRSCAGSDMTRASTRAISGGPLVNMQGEIVGINEVSFGLSGAIPGNLACSRGATAHRAWPRAAQLDRPVRATPAEIRHANTQGVLITGAIADRRR